MANISNESSFTELLQSCSTNFQRDSLMLAKRGFTSDITNGFIVVGSTATIRFSQLAKHARMALKDTAPMVMVIMLPLKVVISGRDFSDPAKNAVRIPNELVSRAGENVSSHAIALESTVLIDEMDFCMEDGDEYMGLAPGKVVRLQHSICIRCEDVEYDEFGEPSAIHCSVVSESETTEHIHSIQWVPASTAIPLELRLYNHTFSDAQSTSGELDWSEELSARNEIVVSTAMADPSLLDWSPLIDKHFRFGQLGYFWLDTEESEAKKQLIFVQTVKLVSESDSQADTAVQSEAQTPLRADEVNSLVSDDNEESGDSRKKPPANEVIVPVTSDLPQQPVEEEAAKAKKPKKRLEHVPLPEEAPVASADSASAAPSAEEDDDLSVMERRQAAQLRIDQEKQARLAEIAAFSSGGGPESESLSLTERAELARRKAEEDNAARLEAEKQAKLVEFLGSNSSGDAGDKLSVTERAALALRTSAEEERANAELARQAKLAEFLGEDSSPDKVSVADRARLAKLAAEQETQAKLERLRQEKMAEFAQKSSADAGDDTTNSPMLSLAERTERARVKAEHEKTAKLEQEKQAKLEGFLKKDQQSGGAVDSPGGVVDWENMTLAQRRESAKRQAEQDKQARLAEFLKQSSDSSADTPEQPAGSVKDRFENAKKLQAQQEEERLARIKGDPNKRISIGNAYSDNLSAVNSPVNADSGVTPDNKHRSQGSLKNKWDQSLSETRANKEADRVSTGGAKEERRLSGRTTSLKNVWAEALNESKNTEDNRVRSTKRQTIAQFRVTDGTGIVKKRIGEWEELFMQIAATVEQLEETLKAARLLSLSNSLEGRSIDELKEAQKKFRESCLLPETFIIGATHIYNIKLLDFSVASYIKRSLGDSRAKHFALSCGVYGEATQPPIEVYAAAIKTDEAYPSYYVALTIKAVEGHELDAEAYGVKKVAIFSKDVNQKILDLIVDIVPQQGWEAWIAEGHYGSESQDSLTPASRRQSSAAPQTETVEEEQEDEPEGDSTVIVDDPFLSDVGAPVGGSATESSVNVGESLIDALAAESVEETTESASETVEIVEEAAVDQSSTVDTVVVESTDNAQDTHTQEQDDVIGVTESAEEVATAEEEKAVVEDGEDKCESEEGDQFVEEPHAPVMNDLDRGSEFEVEPDADDDCAEDVTEPFNYGRTLSVAHVGMARSFMPSPNKKSTFEMSSHTASKFSWSGADEIDEGLPSANLTTVYVDLNDVVTTYSSSNLFVLEGRESSTLFTGTLKSTSTATKYMVHNDKIFQWIRGAAISGWCVKWPMKSQSFGRRSKRFFVLRDNLITYHNRKPEKEDDVLANYSSKNSIVLTEETTVAMTRHYFLRAMTITTPEDTLWIRFRSLRGNEEKETRWRNELQKAIQHQSRKKLFMSKVRVESMWYHESPHISIVAIDALSIGEKYAKVALFCLAETPETAPVAEPVRRSSFSLSKSPTPPPNAARPVMRRSSRGDYEVCTNKFSIDIGASDTERIQLEILRPNESPYLTSNLSCVKIYGDMALFGGAAGFIGIGVIGRTAAADEAPPRKVMFCVTCNESAAPGSPSAGSPPVSGRKTEHNKSTSSMDGSPTRRLADGPSAFGQNPHHKDATILTFAVGNISNIFAAADSLGAISIWSLEKSSSAARSKRHSTESLLEKIRPDFQSSVNLIGMGSSGNHKGQRVIKMHFLPNDTHLVVCTNKRLLLLEISSPVLLGAPQSSPKGFFDMRHGSLSEEHSVTAAAIKGSSFSGADLVLPSQGVDPIAPVRVTGWVELDRVAVGCSGVFSMHVEELPASNSSNAQETAITTGDSSKGTNDADSEQTKAPEDEQNTAAVSTTAAQVRPLLSHHRIVQWKVTEDDDLVSLKPQKSSSKSKLSKCTIYRFEWSPEMLSAALLKMKYI